MKKLRIIFYAIKKMCLISIIGTPDKIIILENKILIWPTIRPVSFQSESAIIKYYI